MPPELVSTRLKILAREYEIFGVSSEGWIEIFKTQKQVADSYFNFSYLQQIVQRNWTCLDVGANLGIVTLAMAQLVPLGQVLAFEPDPESFVALRKTLDAAAHENVRAQQWAIGEDNMRGTIVEDPKFRSSTHFMPAPEGKNGMHSIDSMKLLRCDLIKIDAEGSELEVLAGAKETLAKHRPLCIIEFNSFAFMTYRDMTPRSVLKTIRNLFARVRYFDKQNPYIIHELRDGEQFLADNILAHGFVDDLICTF